MRNTLEKRILFMAFALLGIAILVNTVMGVAAFRRDYVDAMILRSQSIGMMLKGSLEKVMALGLDLRDLPGVQDRCREVVQASPEIEYCVVTDMEGNFLYLSDPQWRELRFDVVHRTYAAESLHRVRVIGANVRYYDTAVPIMQADGQRIGQVHVGFAVATVNQHATNIILRSLALLLVVLLISFALTVLFVKRQIVRPVTALHECVQRITEGSFDFRVPSLGSEELDRLGSGINVMAQTLEARTEEIKASYRELEKAHADLHASFLRLESLSRDLSKSEELYKAIHEDASDAILLISDQEKVVMANKKAGEFFGQPVDLLVNQQLGKLLQMIGAETPQQLHAYFQSALQGGDVDAQLVFEREGQRTIGRMHASSIVSGNERLVQAIVRDVTRETTTMANLEQSAADLAKLNKMKDSFLGLASHELKTPLTVIIGYAELILTEMRDKADTNVIAMVENIAGAAGRLDSIVKDMVDVSMIDERRLQLKTEMVNVNRLVESATTELRLFFSLRKLQLHLELAAELPAIKADPIRLSQALGNILGNAIKFTPDGGEVRVQTRLHRSLRNRGGEEKGAAAPFVSIGRQLHPYVEICVSDTGIGIDADDHLRIFEKFYEVGNIEEHSSGKIAFKGKGTGLGLAIARGIVELHDGEVWVESTGYDPVNFPGSTFHILLPLDPVLGDGSIDYLNLLS